MRTRACQLSAPRGAVAVADRHLPEPGPGEVLVRMEACGICHSDLFVAGLGKLPVTPLVLGHEAIGRVAGTGQRVGVTFLASTCGECEYCRSGAERFCARQTNHGFSAQGAMANYAVVAAQHLAAVPDALSAAEAAPLCCAGWTAFGALREAGVPRGGAVALFGMGGLGQLAVQYARHAGLRPIAVDVSEAKLEAARALGAELSLPAEGAGRAIQKQAGGAAAAIVLTAAPAAIGEACRSVKRTGTVVLVGLASANFEMPIVDTVLKGITIRGSFLGTREDLAEVFRLAASGAVRPRVETYALEEAPALLERLRAGQIAGRAVVSLC